MAFQTPLDMPSSWTRNAFRSGLAVMMSDLKAFLVQDDGMSKGVWNAIEAAGKQDQIIIASQGFYEWSIPYLKEGKFAFTITYPAGFFARDAMNVIKSVSDGETVERVQWLGMELVTAENADTAAHD